MQFVPVAGCGDDVYGGFWDAEHVPSRSLRDANSFSQVVDIKLHLHVRVSNNHNHTTPQNNSTRTTQNNINTIWRGSVLTGEAPPPLWEVASCLLQSGGPTQSQLSRPLSSGHHASIEHHPLRRKRQQSNRKSNTDTDAGNAKIERSRRRKKEKKKTKDKYQKKVKAGVTKKGKN